MSKKKKANKKPEPYRVAVPDDAFAECKSEAEVVSLLLLLGSQMWTQKPQGDFRLDTSIRVGGMALERMAKLRKVQASDTFKELLEKTKGNSEGSKIAAQYIADQAGLGPVVTHSEWDGPARDLTEMTPAEAHTAWQQANNCVDCVSTAEQVKEEGIEGKPENAVTYGIGGVTQEMRPPSSVVEIKGIGISHHAGMSSDGELEYWFCTECSHHSHSGVCPKTDCRCLQDG